MRLMSWNVCFEWFVSCSLHPLFFSHRSKGFQPSRYTSKVEPTQGMKLSHDVVFVAVTCGRLKKIISGMNELKSWKVTGRNLILSYFDLEKQVAIVLKTSTVLEICIFVTEIIYAHGPWRLKVTRSIELESTVICSSLRSVFPKIFPNTQRPPGTKSTQRKGTRDALEILKLWEKKQVQQSFSSSPLIVSQYH